MHEQRDEINYAPSIRRHNVIIAPYSLTFAKLETFCNLHNFVISAFHVRKVIITLTIVIIVIAINPEWLQLSPLLSLSLSPSLRWLSYYQKCHYHIIIVILTYYRRVDGNYNFATTSLHDFRRWTFYPWQFRLFRFLPSQREDRTHRAGDRSARLFLALLALARQSCPRFSRLTLEIKDPTIIRDWLTRSCEFRHDLALTSDFHAVKYARHRSHQSVCKTSTFPRDIGHILVVGGIIRSGNNNEVMREKLVKPSEVSWELYARKKKRNAFAAIVRIIQTGEIYQRWMND